MATLSLTNSRSIQVPSEVAAFMSERIVENSAFLQSSAVAAVSTPNTGLIHNAPINRGWVQIGASNVSAASGSAATPSELTYLNQRYAVVEQNQTVREADFAETEAGYDIEGYLAGNTAVYWAKEMSSRLSHSFQGIAQADSAALRHNLAQTSGAVTDSNRLTPTTLYSSVAEVQGEQVQDGGVLVCNSAAAAALYGQNAVVQGVTLPEAGVVNMVGPFILVVDDRIGLSFAASVTSVLGQTGLATTGAKAVSYVFRPGAVKVGMGTPKTPFGMDRNELAYDGGGSFDVTTRIRWANYLENVDYTRSDAGTNTQLATAATWDILGESKAVGMTAIIHNI